MVNHKVLNQLIYIKVEPYWNVNQLVDDEECKAKLIKVEPYWNVNYLKMMKLKI